MEIDIKIGEHSMSLEVENPFRLDILATEKSIKELALRVGTDIGNLDIGRLIARMIKGVAGCEHGCPADAKTLVRSGFGSFKLSYIDGGILSALCPVNGGCVEIKVFPEF
ncbi:MAG: hypothetical protein HQK89_08295 [Nitrospirae bacterium]|nr:hypothetical protein [Nitrospirota bacterium]